MIDYYHNGLVIAQIPCFYSCFLLLFRVLHPKADSLIIKH